MEIKDRIKKISQYFKGMQITTTDDGSQVVYVVVSFPNGWIVDEELEEKFGITISQGTNMSEYYFCTDIDSGEQVLFDAIDYNIDKMKEAIERAQLLSKKTSELKDIFTDENVTIEQLRTLTFSYSTEKKDQPLVTKKKQKETEENNSKKEEINE